MGLRTYMSFFFYKNIFLLSKVIEMLWLKSRVLYYHLINQIVCYELKIAKRSPRFWFIILDCMWWKSFKNLLALLINSNENLHKLFIKFIQNNNA